MRNWILARRVPIVLLGTVSAVLWTNILLVKGISGVVSWWLVMAFGSVGVLLLLGTIISGVIKLIRRKKVEPSWLLLLFLSWIAAWPLGWLLNIGEIAYPANINSAKPAAYIRLPIDQPALVGWGGDRLDTNYHAKYPNERWAYDLLAAPAAVNSPRLEDYGIYGVKVVAPASGIIVSARDDEPDLVPGNEDYKSMAGNRIVMRLDETGTYLMIAHLKQGSVLVKEGQHVKEGTEMAQAGNSGASSEPHIHIHHQRQDPSKTSIFLSEGLPLYFRDIEGPSMPKGGVQVMNGKEVPVGDTIRPVHQSVEK